MSLTKIKDDYSHYLEQVNVNLVAHCVVGTASLVSLYYLFKKPRIPKAQIDIEVGNENDRSNLGTQHATTDVKKKNRNERREGVIITQEQTLDPVGSYGLKNMLGRDMARIAVFRESRKSKQATPAQHEAFHKAEPHPFFNESHYYNGADIHNTEKLITRISRRGEGGKLSYVFLLLHLSQDGGALSLEEDEVPVNGSLTYPSARGLSYRNKEPMKTWVLTYNGPMKRGCHSPGDKKGRANAETVNVRLALEYERETPVFWYMRDDCIDTLGKNLSQEPWGIQFAKYCLSRSQNHGHYEDFGRLTGAIAVGNGPPRTYDFGTFRDHSWDIRRWQAMDNLLILLLALNEPITIDGVNYHYLDLTLVSMPGNIGGVQRYTTGYVLGKNPGSSYHDGPRLPCTCATSILDIGWKDAAPNGEREPLDETHVVMYVGNDQSARGTERKHGAHGIEIHMTGDIRRLIYWPDHGAFKVYEDSMDFKIRNLDDGKVVSAYGTRQQGYRVGDFDPSLGGVG